MVSLISAIAFLTVTITQVHQVPNIPQPYSYIVHALTSARSYRVVEQSTQTIDNSVETTAVTVIQRGGTVQTYTVLTRTVPGQTPQFLGDHVDTGSKMCDRMTLGGSWSCMPWPRLTPANLTASVQRPPLSSPRWTTIGTARVRGRLCRGYETTWRTPGESKAHTVLWIARADGQPVEAKSTESGTTTSGTVNTIQETAVWSDWNNPALQIPRT